MKPGISQRYDHVPNHWYFERNSRPYNNSPPPLRDRLIDWGAVVFCAAILGLAIAFFTAYFTQG